VTGPERMEMRESPPRSIGPRKMLRKVEMASICGSEPKKYQGTPMRTAELGSMPFPFIPGYEMVGYMEESMRLFREGGPGCIRVTLRP
jgi:threonine dehydrogenase-like Zn-dependent dehydrogenase